MQVTVISLDIWGNETDGWEVNDCHKLGHFEMDAVDFDNDDALIHALITNDYLAEHVTPDSVNIDWMDENSCYINRAEDGRPLLEIRGE